MISWFFCVIKTHIKPHPYDYLVFQFSQPNTKKNYGCFSFAHTFRSPWGLLASLGEGGGGGCGNKSWEKMVGTLMCHGHYCMENTLPPRIMEVENGCFWKVTTIGGTHFPLPWLWEKGCIFDSISINLDWLDMFVVTSCGLKHNPSIKNCVTDRW